ncbi:MAG: hypothetical protein ABR502_02715 [Chitinophagaceae bacterium]
MKKILIVLLVITALFTTSDIQAQKVKYYYYPAANVYYNPVTKQYAYVDNGTWNWYNAEPATAVSGQRRVLVYHTNEAVWADNATHAAKYKVTPVPKGKAVGYKGTNPNRKSGNATGYKGSNPNRQAGKVKVKSKG